MRKVLRVNTLIITPLISVCAFLSGCKSCGGKHVDIDNSDIMQDINVSPTQSPAYEQYSRQAIEEYKQVAAMHLDGDGEVDIENAEVIQAANSAAAKLFAYACYNERTLDKYVYFSNQDGETDLGGSGFANATRQEYYLRVNESENTCGYRYHYTIKKVLESGGLISGFKSLFESARIRITDKTNLLYRFEGDKIIEGGENASIGVNMLECEWATGKDWGKPDVEMKKSAFIAPEDIEKDIQESAGNDNITMRANINILADNIIKKANIFEAEDGCISVIMWIDTDIANRDEASLKMIRKGNGSGDCSWKKDAEDEDDTGFMIYCTLWQNGMFRFYNVQERWSGTIQGFKGTVQSQTTYHYSYSDRDCDMKANLEMLEAAKKLKGE